MIRTAFIVALLTLPACAAADESVAQPTIVTIESKGRQIITKLWLNHQYSDEVCIAYEDGPTLCSMEQFMTNRFEVSDASGAPLNEDDYLAAATGIDAVCYKVGLGGSRNTVNYDHFKNGIFGVIFDCNEPTKEVLAIPVEE